MISFFTISKTTITIHKSRDLTLERYSSFISYWQEIHDVVSLSVKDIEVESNSSYIAFNPIEVNCSNEKVELLDLGFYIEDKHLENMNHYLSMHRT